jgi:hypothetical protein
VAWRDYTAGILFIDCFRFSLPIREEIDFFPLESFGTDYFFLIFQYGKSNTPICGVHMDLSSAIGVILYIFVPNKNLSTGAFFFSV